MRTLLLADDSATIQRVVELTFATENVKVVTVGDGEQAMARIAAERPDIVLADIATPKQSGYDVSAFVKGRPDLAHIPVLLLAGAFEPVDDARAEQVKCDGVLVKPFEPQHVIARVRELLDGAAGSPQRAAPDIPRPVERLAPLKLVEPARREAAIERPAQPERPAEIAAFKREPDQHASPVMDGALDDYFDRLDAAFASLDAHAAAAPEPASPGASPADHSEDALDIPTLEKLLGEGDRSRAGTPRPASSMPRLPIDLAQYSLPPIGQVHPPPPASAPVEPPDVSPTRAPDAPPPVTRAEPPAPERAANDRDEVIARAFHSVLAAERGDAGASEVLSQISFGPPVISDALVDEVSRRVLARLSPDVVRDAIADLVGAVAERLVSQEIARIRAEAETKS